MAPVTRTMRKAILPSITNRIPEKRSRRAIGRNNGVPESLLFWRKSNATRKMTIIKMITWINFTLIV